MENPIIKKLSLLSLIVALPLLFLTAQQSEDYQWLVMEGIGKEGIHDNSLVNKFDPSNTVGGSIKISGIANPDPPVINIGDPSMSRVFMNDYFAIFSDGSYGFFKQGYNELPFLKDPNGNTFTYVYLTNTYEEDDPPSMVVVDDGDGEGLDPISKPGNLKVNHNPVADKDLTIIIENVSEDRCSLEYTLTNINSLDPYGDFKLVPSGFNDEGNILHGISNAVTNSIVNFNDNQSDAFTTEHENTYLNFRVEFTEPSVLGSQFDLDLNCDISGNHSLFINEQDRYEVSGGPHDPNYVELQCVWSEDKKCKWLPFIVKKKKYARYKVFCYNESRLEEVSTLEFSFTLPSVAKNKVKVCNQVVNGTAIACPGNNGWDNNDFPRITYSFNNGLGLFPLAQQYVQHEGYIEFVIELKPDTDIGTADLTIINPTSHFDNYPYPIDDFIDTTRNCKNQGPTRNPSWECQRKEEKCECICKTHEQQDGPAK